MTGVPHTDHGSFDSEFTIDEHRLAEANQLRQDFLFKEVAHLVEELKAARASVVAVLMPSLDELIESRCEAYPYDKTFAEAEDEPVIICHTSGSTGELD